MTESFNSIVANQYREAAQLLEEQGANPHRVRALRQAALQVERLDRDLKDVVREGGRLALVALPAIGWGLAAAICEILTTGKWSQLERLRGTHDPCHLFESIPGIGPELAHSIHEVLHVDSFEELERALQDGRLGDLPGMGPRRLQAVEAYLRTALEGRRRQRERPARADEPDVGMLLDVDREYRDRAGRSELRRIAPHRNNPNNDAWLPVLHTTRGIWHFTALFSNTARAHELGRTHDWVVLYYYDDHHREAQATVVTETHGQLEELRVVRGREAECAAWYARHGFAIGSPGPRLGPARQEAGAPGGRSVARGRGSA